MPVDRKPKPTPVRDGADVFAAKYRRAVNAVWRRPESDVELMDAIAEIQQREGGKDE